MKVHRWRDLLAEKYTPEEIAELDRQVAEDLLEMDLRALREATGLTQAEVAARTEMLQPAIARLESRAGDARMPTLRRYVHALGGTLEVAAVIGGKRIVLSSS